MHRVEVAGFSGPEVRPPSERENLEVPSTIPLQSRAVPSDRCLIAVRCHGGSTGSTMERLRSAVLHITGWVNAALASLAGPAGREGIAWEAPGTRFAALSVGSRGFVNRRDVS